MAIILGDRSTQEELARFKNIAIIVEDNDFAPHLKDRRLCETHLQENTI